MKDDGRPREDENVYGFLTVSSQSKATGSDKRATRQFLDRDERSILLLIG